ncbi:MAG TPA: two-component regulator propeller domain-containing protein, partial [Saprospiraceae bacterium]|nr:two-component regulator propeller domain-containing protein [Saprospiraceae bacterium]
MRTLYILLFIFQITSWNIGQQVELKFINYSSKDGLTSNSVNAILKDKNGFMWFATEDGLNRFDGQNITAYHHRENDSTSIGRGPVVAMTQDKYGKIWLATNHKLSSYNINLDEFISFEFSNYGWITSLCADHDGKIWVGTYTGLFIFDPNNRTV